MLDPELKSKINKLWNAFWAGGLSNPLSAIEQISYLIFMKRLDDLDTHNMNAAQARGQTYTSIFEERANCRWSTWKHMSADPMYKHVSETVFPFIKNLQNGEDIVYSTAMKDATFMIPKPSLLQEAVALLDEINVGERPDIQGDIYEHLLGELKTAGKNGQFRTPRHIIRMMVDLARAISKVNLKKIVHALTHRLFEM
jgi:type I restriction enzyme M protein